MVLPFRDRASTVKRAIESVLVSARVRELIAIDDGSVDTSRAHVTALARRDPRIQLVDGHGQGIARALARGVERAGHELIGRMDADDESLPGRFEASCDLLLQDPRLGAVGTQVEVAAEQPMPGLEAYVCWQNALLSPEAHAADLFVESPLCHPSTLLRRVALERAGGYQEVPWPEDYDLWLRMAAAGYSFAKVPEVLLRWHHGVARATFQDPRCDERAILGARALYLAQHLRQHLGSAARPIVLWGAGKTGRRLGQALARHGVPIAAWVDIDPRRLGKTLHGAPILGPDALPDAAFVVVAVRGRGGHALSQAERARGDAGSPSSYARDVVRARLRAAGRLEGDDFVCGA